jgi:MFS transporter, DHA1 family, inner membrane transport protein
MNKQERFLLITLAFVQFTHVMDFMIMMPLSTQFQEAFGISPAKFGALVASYNISAGIVSLLGALFIDRFDRRRVMLLAYACLVTGTIACGLAQSYGMLLAARIFTGMFGGVLSATLLSIVGDSIPFERRASAMAIVMSGFAAAAVLGVPVGSIVANAFSWHIPFFAIAAVGILVFAGIVKFIPTMRNHIAAAKANKPLQNLFDIFNSANRLRALLLMALLMMGHFAIIPYIPTYVEYNVGLPRSNVAWIYLSGGICSVVAMRIVGRFADKHGPFKVFAVLSVLAVIPLVFITHLPPTTLAVVLTATCLFFVFGGTRTVPSSTLITATAQSHQRGGFLSINAAVQQLASGLAAFIGGLLVVELPNRQIAHYDWVGYVAVAASLLAIPVAYFVKPVGTAKR